LIEPEAGRRDGCTVSRSTQEARGVQPAQDEIDQTVAEPKAKFMVVGKG
jgi:hypothetical protein